MKRNFKQLNKIFKRNIDLCNSASDIEKLKNRRPFDVGYMKNLFNLPLKLKDAVYKAINNCPPKNTECILYSQYIAASIPNVNVEVGLFSFDNLNSIQQSIISQCKPNSWFKYIYDGIHSIGYMDTNSKLWILHSWNSFNGIHFDCMKDEIYKVNDKGLWIDYKRVRTLNLNLPTKELRKTMIELVKNVLLSSRI